MKKLTIFCLVFMLNMFSYGQKPKIIIFLAAQCPCAYNHQETFGSLILKYKGTIDFIAISVEKNDKAADIKEMLLSLTWDIKFVIDKDKKYQKKYQPRVTTECMLISPTGDILYRGAVDDSPLNLGQVKNFYLNDAIEDYFNKKTIRTKETKPVGCLIDI